MSATPQPSVAVSTLRDAVARAVGESSTRAVAADVGMSQQGLRKFLAGSTPHPSTGRKLMQWFLRTSEVDADTASVAIDLLMRGYPEAQRERVRARLLETLREAHQAAGTKPPDWLNEAGETKEGNG